jgi:hypothetical protein
VSISELDGFFSFAVFGWSQYGSSGGYRPTPSRRQSGDSVATSSSADEEPTDEADDNDYEEVSIYVLRFAPVGSC